VWRAANQVDPGDLRPTGPLQLGHATSCDWRPPRDPYPTTTPPQHSGGASSTDYRKRRTRTPQAAGQPQGRDVRPRPHTSGRHRGRARRRLRRSARAAETSTDRNTKKCLGRVCCRTSRQSLSESRSLPRV
jgi:hypothetical protein